MYQRIGFRGVAMGLGAVQYCASDSDCGAEGYCCQYPDGKTRVCANAPTRAESILQCLQQQTRALSCPAGTTWNPDHEQCEGQGEREKVPPAPPPAPPPQTTCPTGQTMVNGVCTPTAAPKANLIFGMSPVVAGAVGVAGVLVVLKVFGAFR